MEAESSVEYAAAEARRELARELPSALLLITDRYRAALPLTDAVHKAVQAGVRWVRVREPDLDLFGYMSLCHALIDAVGNERVTWSVRPSAYLLMRSSYPELMLAVHLTSADASWSAPEDSLMVGRSAHSGDAGHADDAVTYRLFAPVFATASKPGVAPAGLSALAHAAQIAESPVIALGGITALNAHACLSAGAAAVAVCGGVMGAPSVERAVRSYLETLGGAIGP